MPLLFSSLVALALLTATAGLFLLRRGRSPIAQRLEEVRRGEEDRAFDPEENLEQTSPLPARILGLFGWLLPLQLTSETLRWELAQAGYRFRDAPVVFAGARVLCMTAFGLSFFMAATAMDRVSGEVLILTLLGVFVGFMAPSAFLRWRQAKRREEITFALPDALDLLVICVEAGLGLNAAIQNVGREIRMNSATLSDELRMVNHEIRAGLGRSEALRNLAIRTGVDEMRALTAVLIQTDRFGTSIAQALRAHAQSLRTRRRQRAEETARKTPVKMVFPLVFFIFPELLVVILAPGMLQLFRALLEISGG